MYESLSTHSSTQILKKVYHILLHHQECDLAQICTNQRRCCQYRGFSCRTALDQLSKQCRKLPQGSLSPYIMYAGSAIVLSMTSCEAHPRSTTTGRRIVGVAIDSVFHPQNDCQKLQEKVDKPNTTNEIQISILDFFYMSPQVAVVAICDRVWEKGTFRAKCTFEL